MSGASALLPPSVPVQQRCCRAPNVRFTAAGPLPTNPLAWTWGPLTAQLIAPADGSQSRRLATVVAASGVVRAALVPYPAAKAYLARCPLVGPSTLIVCFQVLAAARKRGGQAGSAGLAGCIVSGSSGLQATP